MDNTMYLVLENGKVFKGCAMGARGETVGEVVFQTAVLGYNETITDPKYFGQIVVQTFPLVGNYGTISEEFNSKGTTVGGYIVKSICDTPSNFRAEGTLEDYLKENNIVGLCDIDTRELTRIIRENGTMNAKITSDISNMDSIISELKEFNNKVSYEKVSVLKPKCYKSEKSLANIAIYDFGATDSFIDSFVSMGLDVTVVPYNTPAEDIISGGYDGIVISEGPGNPLECTDLIEKTKQLIDSNIPLFGCGLGHQLIAIALNGKVIKHKYGHRGANQAVKDVETGKIYITNQNHGFIVDAGSLPIAAKISFINANDSTVEGLSFKDKKIMTTQFNVNICKGPHNTGYIIDNFIKLMKGDK